MNQTPDQMVSISITPFLLCLWWFWKGKSPCCLCKSQVSQSQEGAAPGCTHNPKSCAGLWSNKTGPMGSEFNPPSHRDSLPGQGIGPWSGTVTTAGQKFTADTGSVQWNTLQEMPTHSLTWLKRNRTVFRFFGMEWESSRAASHMNDLFCLLSFFHHWIFYFRLSVFHSLGVFLQPSGCQFLSHHFYWFSSFSKPSCLQERMQF